MVFLIFHACLIEAADQCKPVKLQFDESKVTVQECSKFGMMALAQWVGNNPAWHIKDWKCSAVEEKDM